MRPEWIDRMHQRKAEAVKRQRLQKQVELMRADYAFKAEMIKQTYLARNPFIQKKRSWLERVLGL